MRSLLPVVMSGVALALGAGAGGALASQPANHQKRLASHVTLHVSRHSVLSGNGLVLRGRVRPRGARRVKLVMRGTGGETIGAKVARSGKFSVRWSPSRTGVYGVRAYAVHDRTIRSSLSVAREITAYRPASASYYGPGLYGGALACGGTLEPGTLGVASKTLPCGSKVKLRYRGRSLTVRVVDRGPYVAGRAFDLTAATRARLHFPDVGVLLFSR